MLYTVPQIPIRYTRVMWIKGLQAISVILITVGTWLLAFGLKVKPGIDQTLETELITALNSTSWRSLRFGFRELCSSCWKAEETTQV